MKQVSTSMESAELGLLKNMLDEAGIRCALRNEQLSQALPEAPFNVELWVEDDDDLRGAGALQHLVRFPAWRDGYLDLRQVWPADQGPV